ncbi:MAG: hypothetical protein WA063_00340 [Minisyncoccia bacterium]
MKKCFKCGGTTIESGNTFTDGTKELHCPKCDIYIPEKFPEPITQTIRFLKELLKNSGIKTFPGCQ